MIAGISAAIPEFVASNLHPSSNDVVSNEYYPEAFVETTRVWERLSWGTVYYETDHLIILELVEESDSEVDKIHVV